MFSTRRMAIAANLAAPLAIFGSSAEADKDGSAKTTDDTAKETVAVHHAPSGGRPG